MVVYASGYAGTVSKPNKSTNKTSNPAFHTSNNTNLATNPAYSLIDKDKQAQVAAVVYTLLQNEFYAVYKPG